MALQDITSTPALWFKARARSWARSFGHDVRVATCGALQYIMCCSFIADKIVLCTEQSASPKTLYFNKILYM